MVSPTGCEQPGRKDFRGFPGPTSQPRLGQGCGQVGLLAPLGLALTVPVKPKERLEGE